MMLLRGLWLIAVVVPELRSSKQKTDVVVGVMVKFAARQVTVHVVFDKIKSELVSIGLKKM